MSKKKRILFWGILLLILCTFVFGLLIITNFFFCGSEMEGITRNDLEYRFCMSCSDIKKFPLFDKAYNIKFSYNSFQMEINDAIYEAVEYTTEASATSTLHFIEKELARKGYSRYKQKEYWYYFKKKNGEEISVKILPLEYSTYVYAIQYAD